MSFKTSKVSVPSPSLTKGALSTVSPAGETFPVESNSCTESTFVDVEREVLAEVITARFSLEPSFNSTAPISISLDNTILPFSSNNTGAASPSSKVLGEDWYLPTNTLRPLVVPVGYAPLSVRIFARSSDTESLISTAPNSTSTTELIAGIKV